MIRKIFLSFYLLLFIFQVQWAIVIPLPDIQKPHLIVSDNSQLFIVEDTTITIYSLKDLKPVKKFGKMGEGPGELKGYISAINILPDSIIINSVGRISWFDRECNFLKQQNDTSIGHNYKIIGNNYAGMRLVRGEKTIYFSINIFNSKLKIVKELHRYRHPFFGKKRKIDPINIRISSYFVFDNKLYIDKEGGVISVYDESGNYLYSFDSNIIPVKITSENKKKNLDFWKSDLKEEYKVFKDRLEFPGHFPAIRDFQVSDNKIYILTYKKEAENNELLIYDLKGKLLKKTMVPLAETNMILPHLFNYYTIRNNRIYKLVDNYETETWELHIIDLN